MSLDIVIVNWNSGNHLVNCVSSIFDSDNSVVKSIIIVDNGSTDNSLQEIKNFSNVDVIQTGENLGFGAACNLGAKLCKSDYILFLNPDAVLRKDTLFTSMSFMEDVKNRDIAVCGIQLIDEIGHVSRSCARFPNLLRFTVSAFGLDKIVGFKKFGLHMSDWDHLDSRVVDHVMGAFYLIRRDIFNSVEGFDEQFFVYLEDLDLSKKVSSIGFKSYYLTTCNAFHAGGGSSRQVKARRLFYSLRSRLLYSFKYFLKWQAWTILLLTLFIEPLTRSIWCLVKFDFSGFKNTMSAYRMLFSNMRHILNGDGRYNP